MWRSLFLAIGIFICVVGVECLFIEKAAFTNMGKAAETTADPWTLETTKVRPKTREVTPPEWAPFGLLAGGIVVIIYSFTIPRRMAG